MRIGQTIIRPLVLEGKMTAWDIMQALYQQFPALSFEDDLIEYARKGFVRISPTSMAFAKIARDEHGEYWFIRAAVGNLIELLCMLPAYLPRIAWCRNADNEIRMYRTEQLIRIATRKERQNGRRD